MGDTTKPLADSAPSEGADPARAAFAALARARVEHGLWPRAQFRHARSGKRVAIVCLSLDEPTRDVLVTYEEVERGGFWTRRLDAFVETVVVREIETPRFVPEQAGSS